VESIDVVLIDLPRMLSDIVANVVEPQPDLRLVHGTARQPMPRADVAITCVEDGEWSPELTELLCTHPDMRVLALSDDGRQACVYKVRFFRTELGDVSPDSLLAAIRAGG
jgi:hypothetical protein